MTQIAPIRCVGDSWAHMNILLGDVFCWRTNLGWVMRPILLDSSFLCGATQDLYHGSPLGFQSTEFSVEECEFL